MKNTQPNNTDELKAIIKATWASKTLKQCYRLIFVAKEPQPSIVRVWSKRMKETFFEVTRQSEDHYRKKGMGEMAMPNKRTTSNQE